MDEPLFVVARSAVAGFLDAISASGLDLMIFQTGVGARALFRAVAALHRELHVALALEVHVVDQRIEIGRRAHHAIELGDEVQASKGFNIIATANDNQFRKLCEILGAPSLASEYPLSKDRVLARPELTEKLHALTLPRDIENTRARDLVDLAWFIAFMRRDSRGVRITFSTSPAPSARP